MHRRFYVLAALLVILGVVALLVLRPTLERLVTPGPLSRVHASLETRCAACHLSFTPSAENSKCKACHEDVKGDVENKRGFHGRSPKISGQQCRACHSEHKGRDFKIAALEQSGFDHGLSNFPLRGGHGKATCSSCHRPGAKFRQAPTTCVACHAANDVHKGRFGRDCASCHTDTDWKKLHHFDHRLTTFPLLGAHASTACAACHVNGTYQGAPTQCAACHVKDDVHKGSYGRDCQSCHTPAGWKDARFDHGRTRFPLIGGHARASCASCHGAQRQRPRPPMTCVACHASDDIHKGRNGPNCASCHTQQSWKGARFDHDRATRFPLRGAHRKIACATCHTRPVKSFKPPTTCVGCHSRQDPHRQQLGTNCAACHTNDKWKPASSFNHQATRFPLSGRHAQLSCATCHRTQAFKAAGTNCASCHADSFHKGRLGTPANCASCHNSSGWGGARFDHNSTRFPLAGRHSRITCSSCHSKPARSARLPTNCHSCHKADDAHEGRFGTKCESCHTSAETFKSVRLQKGGGRLFSGWSGSSKTVGGSR